MRSGFIGGETIVSAEINGVVEKGYRLLEEGLTCLCEVGNFGLRAVFEYFMDQFDRERYDHDGRESNEIWEC